MIRIFTGNGKGKTTAALGTALSAALQGRRVAMIQFLKGSGYTGELTAIRELSLPFSIRQFGYGCPFSAEIRSGAAVCTKCGQCFGQNRNPANGYADLAWQAAREAAADAELLVLDEVSHALNRKLLPLDAFVDWLRSLQTDVVLTGRNMPQILIELAEAATECQPLRHPMQQGIDARRGTEY